jgi:outer membrane protein assembly factor BamB
LWIRDEFSSAVFPPFLTEGALSVQKILLIFGGVVLLLCALFVRPRHGGGTQPAASASASGPQILWRASGGFSEIAIGPDGTIFGGGGNSISAVAANGNFKWKKTLAGFLMPIVGDDKNIYIASDKGLIWGVSPEDGRLVWDPKYGLIGFGAPPALGSGGSVLYANTMSDLWAFKPPAQKELWSQNTQRQGFLSRNSTLPMASSTGGMHSRSSPAVWRDGSIILPRARWLHRFNPDGSPDWVIQLTSTSLGLVALAEDGTAYVADDRKLLFAVDRSGNLKWSYQADDYLNLSPIVGPDGTVYFATQSHVVAVNPDGRVKWKAPVPKWCRTSPALAEDGTIYIGGDGGITALHSDGSEKWTISSTKVGGIGYPSSPTISPDGTIFTSCGYNQICAIRDEGSPLAKSGWPKAYHDAANTSRTVKMF